MTPSPTPRRRGLAAPSTLALAAALAAGCDAGSVPPDAVGSGALSIGVPETILSARDVDRDALGVDVTVNGESVEAERGPDGWTVRTDVPEGEAVAVEILWFETIDGEPLTLAAWSRELPPLDSSRTVEVEAGELADASFDQDTDMVSNLAERRAGTDPFVAQGNDGPVPDAPPDEPADDEPPAPRVTGPAPGEEPGLDAELNFVAPSITASIEIDGVFDEGIWERASFRGTNDTALWLNRLLLIDDDDADDPTLQDGVPDYIWFGMHDGVYLYLFAQSEDDSRTPVRDSPGPWFDDDALSVILDPNLSRETALQSDDVYFAYPLVVFDNEARPLVQFEGVLPAPPGIDIGTFHRDGFRSGWEMKIPLAEAGLSVGQKFGLELRIHEDKDGGGFDALYGWASPPIDSQGEDFRFESPARLGTVVLRAPG